MGAVPDTDAPRVVGARVAAARRDRGLSQRDLSLALGIPIYSVDRIEAGASDAREYLSSIATVTGRELEWFTPTATRASKTPSGAVSRDEHGLASAGRLLVLGAIVLLTTIRFFTEVVPVLPRAANFVDIPIFVTLTVAALVAGSAPSGPRKWYLSLGLPAFGFFVLCVLSVIVNSERIAAPPVLVFVYGFLAPIGIYIASYRLWPPGNAGALSRTIIGLGVVQLVVVALVNLPRFVVSRNPDDISGTFGTNAYQLVFFLLLFITLLVGIATFEPGRAAARFAPILITASFVTILLAQYRSLLVPMAVGVLAVALLLRGRVRGLVTVAFAAVSFGVAFYYVAAHLPALKLDSAASSIAASPGTYASGRFRVVQNVSRLYDDIPAAIVVGTGPGTYSSRAWQTFANAKSKSASNVVGRYATALMGGSTYSTDVSDKYVLPQVQTGVIVEGSRAISTPYSSYASLLAEVGIIGFMLILTIYLAAFARSWRMARASLAAPSTNDPVPALALCAVVAFLTLLQAALLENWFEVTRATFVSWALLAVVTRELDARGAPSP